MRYNRGVARALLVSATLVLAAACHDDKSPTGVVPEPFDATKALDALRPLTRVFDQDIYTSFNGALPFVRPFLTLSPAISASRLPLPQMALLGRSAAEGAARALVPAAGVLTNAIPVESRGKTFVYDPTSRTYAIDAAANGAPSSGVRVVLYAWATADGRPATPLTRVGYVDIATPPDSPNADDLLHVIIVRDAPALTVADFQIFHGSVIGANPTGVPGQTEDGTTFGIQGTASDGLTAVHIALSGAYTGTAGHHHLVIDTNLAAISLGLATLQHLTSDQAAATQTGRLEVRYGEHALVDQGVSNGDEVRFDGQLYAKVIAPASPDEQPQYLKADGTPLPSQELADLIALLQPIVVTDFFWTSLAFP